MDRGSITIGTTPNLFMRTLFALAVLSAAVIYVPLLAQTTNVVVPAKVLETYVGQYELMPGFVLTIRKDGDRLTGQATGQARVRLTPRSETDFQVAGID